MRKVKPCVLKCIVKYTFGIFFLSSPSEIKQFCSERLLPDISQGSQRLTIPFREEQNKLYVFIQDFLINAMTGHFTIAQRQRRLELNSNFFKKHPNPAVSA